MITNKKSVGLFRFRRPTLYPTELEETNIMLLVRSGFKIVDLYHVALPGRSP